MFAPETFEECVICGGQIRTVYGSAEWHEENGGIPDNECHCAEHTTLTELSAKHDIPHDKAVAFLRDWLDAQPSYPIDRKHGDVCLAIFKNTQLRKGDMLIARPELGDL